jgi:hypothetical protein
MTTNVIIQVVIIKYFTTRKLFSGLWFMNSCLPFFSTFLFFSLIFFFDQRNVVLNRRFCQFFCLYLSTQTYHTFLKLFKPTHKNSVSHIIEKKIFVLYSKEEKKSTKLSISKSFEEYIKSY